MSNGAKFITVVAMAAMAVFGTGVPEGFAQTARP